MRWASLFVLCACNQVYGLDQTRVADARFFDAPIDAPYACPAIGDRLAFSPRLHQLLLDCSSYSQSARTGQAVALCRERYGAEYQVAGGPLDGPLVPLAGMPLPSLDLALQTVEIAADGDLLLVGTFDIAALRSDVATYVLSPSGWQVLPSAALVGPTNFTDPTPAPDRRVLVQSVTGELRELALVGGSWTPVRTHPLAAIGVTSLIVGWLSPDGLRVVFEADPATPEGRYMAYAERATTTDTFGPAKRLDIPVVADLFITDDCSRAYFSGVGSIFYAQQL